MPSVLEPLFVTARSGTAPFAKLAITIPAGVVAVGSGDPWAWSNVPSKLLLPSKTVTLLSPWVTTARSGTPSAFKSPVAIATGVVPTEKGELGASVSVTLPAWSTEHNKIETLFEVLFTMARSTSGALVIVAVEKVLFRKFALTIAIGAASKTVPVFGGLKGEPGNSVNVPSPFPRKRETELS